MKRIFMAGFAQVFLVVLSTHFVATHNIVGCIAVSFLIGLVWSFSVKKISIGTFADRVVYALGSSAGSGLSMYLSLTFFR